MAVIDRGRTVARFFVRYLREAAKWLSIVDLKHRGVAIERSKAPLHAVDGVTMVSTTLWLPGRPVVATGGELAR